MLQYIHILIKVYQLLRRHTMWTSPKATELRFGFEVTMYVMTK